MWNKIDTLIANALDADLFAGCSLSIQSVDSVLYSKSYGLAQKIPMKREACNQTQWDLASLTKILATGALCMKLASDGRLDVNQPIKNLIPEAPVNLTARHLLTHTSGYPAWKPYFETLATPSDWASQELKDRIQRDALSSSLVAVPGERAIYSDIGFIVLGYYLERLSNMNLKELWSTVLPFDARKGLNWGSDSAAATEACPFRKTVVCGEVHDLNAAAMGGISTHAGLFATADDACRAALWPLRNLYGINTDIRPEIIRYFWTAEKVGQHCLGWDTPSPLGSSASEKWPVDGVGHLGFTGCSIWLAPTQKIAIAFCSNRIHPIIEGGAVPNAPISPRLQAFKRFRPQLHRLSIAALTHLGVSFDA